MRTVFWVLPPAEPSFSTALTVSMPSTTSPNTTCLPSSHDVTTVVMKTCTPGHRQRTCQPIDTPGRGEAGGGRTWEPLVFGPAFAMESRPGLLCRSLKFSSAGKGRTSQCMRRVTRKVGTGSEGRQRVRGQLTSELLAVDRLSTGAVVSCEVPALEHELYRGREATVHTSSHGV